MAIECIDHPTDRYYHTNFLDDTWLIARIALCEEKNFPRLALLSTTLTTFTVTNYTRSVNEDAGYI